MYMYVRAFFFFHVATGPSGVYYIYTPVAVNQLEEMKGRPGVGRGRFVIHELLIAELCPFSPPNKHSFDDSNW